MTQTANTPVTLSVPSQAPVAPVTAAPVRLVANGRYANAAEWWEGLGRIPLERVVMSPWPGTATEHDLLVFAERDKRLCELIDGTLVEKPMGRYESLIACYLITALNTFVLPRKLGFVTGEAGMNRMVTGNVRMPDVTFVSVDDLPNREFPKTPVPSLKPTIAAEVLSVSNTRTEIAQKLKEYFQSGTRLAWVIDLETQTVAIYDKTPDTPSRVLVNTEVLDGGTVLPGFQIPVADLFATTL